MKLRSILLALALVASPCVAHAGETPDLEATLAEAARLDAQVDVAFDRGDLDGALAAAERAVALRRQVLAPTAPRIGESLAQLGAVLHARAETDRAEAALLEAIALLEPSGPPLRLTSALNSLGALRVAQGRRDDGRKLIERAVTIAEKEQPDGTELATYLGNLAQIDRAARRYDQADALYRRSLALHEKNGNARGKVGTMLGLAELEQGRGRNYQATEWWNKAAEVADKELGDDPLTRARLYASLAKALRIGRQYDRAEAMHERAAELLQKHLGERHPKVAHELFAWSETRWAAFRLDGAVALRRRAHAIEEHHLELLLARGDEREIFDYLATLQTSANDTVSLHLVTAQDSAAAAELAFETVLRRKGRVLDTMSQRLATLRRQLDADDAALLDELGAVRRELATLAADLDADSAVRVAELESRASDLEGRIAKRSAAFRDKAAPITVASVQRAIPADAALIEIVRYHPRSKEPWGDSAWYPPRYAAYFVRHQGEVGWALMSDAASVEAVAQQVRKQLVDPREQLDDGLWRLNALSLQRPLIGLEGVAQLIISPDGALNQVPFAALADQHGHVLLERYDITYLASGRDLLRLATEPRAPRSKPLIVAAPDFDAGAATEVEPAAADAPRAALARVRFPPLPGAADEASDLRAMMRDATVLVGTEAREQALRAAHGPRILHLATHGFLLPDPPRRRLPAGTRGEVVEVQQDNPLLRAGLVLAGANDKTPRDDDGVLTALEVSTLDLYGTELVVLSACDTGLGELRRGEGVYGLRRAVAMAGAETLVMSLWQVDDRATRELMQSFYQKLLAGAGRGESLRQAQLTLLADERTAHPYYWAPFIVSGDWRPLAGLGDRKLAPPDAPPKVAPANGCACALAARGGSGGAVGVMLAALLVAARRASATGFRPQASARNRRCFRFQSGKHGDPEA